MSRRMFLLGAAASVALNRAAWAADAQFTRPLRIIVPSAPGGFTDIISRVFGHELAQKLGQPVQIDNRAGAGGVIGTIAAAQSPADGYTLEMGNNNTHAMNIGLYKKLAYDPIKDFVPIVFVASAPTVLVVNPKSPLKSVNDLIALAKAKPGVVTYGSGGNGASSHLAAEMLGQMAGIDLVHVPFRGTSPAVQALMGGDQISFLFDTLPSSLPLVKAGRFRALAVTAAKRIEDLPDVPSMAESLPGFEVAAWLALFAPAGTPQPMVDVLVRESQGILANPAMKAKFAELGATPQARGPKELQAFVSGEISKWTDVIKRAGIAPE